MGWSLLYVCIVDWSNPAIKINIEVLKRCLVSQKAAAVAWKAEDLSIVCESAGWQSKNCHSINSDLAVLPQPLPYLPIHWAARRPALIGLKTHNVVTLLVQFLCLVILTLPFLTFGFSSPPPVSLFSAGALRWGCAGSLYGPVLYVAQRRLGSCPTLKKDTRTSYSLQRSLSSPRRREEGVC